MPAHAADTLRTVNLESLQSTFAVNTFGPLLLTQALLDNVVLPSASASTEPRHIAVVSSRVGSMADNSSGGNYAYRASKAAVNSIFKNLAVDLKDKNVTVSMLHPGFVRTNLDPDVDRNEGVVEPEEAATKLWALFKGKTVEETGRFWHREGMELPW